MRAAGRNRHVAEILPVIELLNDWVLNENSALTKICVIYLNEAQAYRVGVVRVLKMDR